MCVNGEWSMVNESSQLTFQIHHSQFTIHNSQKKNLKRIRYDQLKIYRESILDGR